MKDLCVAYDVADVLLLLLLLQERPLQPPRVHLLLLLELELLLELLLE